MARLLIEVGDTGIGISDADAASIFKPFIQAERSATRAYQGAGLGLAIVRRLAQLMGGTLDIDNREDGTSFFLSLPLPLAEIASNTDSALDDALRPRPTGHLLIVDDDVVSRDIANRWLTQYGHSTAIATNGQEALDLLGKEAFDLVLMDIQMPVLNGIDATKAIRRAALPFHNADVPIVAMTAYAMPGDKEEFLTAGMNAYVSKPLNLQVLTDRIAAILESPADFPPGGGDNRPDDDADA